MINFFNTEGLHVYSAQIVSETFKAFNIDGFDRHLASALLAAFAFYRDSTYPREFLNRLVNTNVIQDDFWIKYAAQSYAFYRREYEKESGGLTYKSYPVREAERQVRRSITEIKNPDNQIILKCKLYQMEACFYLN